MAESEKKEKEKKDVGRQGPSVCEDYAQCMQHAASLAA